MIDEGCTGVVKPHHTWVVVSRITLWRCNLNMGVARSGLVSAGTRGGGLGGWGAGGAGGLGGGSVRVNTLPARTGNCRPSNLALVNGSGKWVGWWGEGGVPCRYP